MSTVPAPSSAPAALRELKPLWEGFEYLPHQTVGVNWMLRREQPPTGPRGGLLCDEMGLGKTIQMAALIRHGAQRPAEQTLLVAPVAVIDQWREVLHRCGLAVWLPAKGTPTWQQDLHMPSGAAVKKPSPFVPRVSIVGYEMAARKPALVHGFTWDRLIYDEAHRLGGGGIGTQIASKIRAERRWFLTATPVVNGADNLVQLFRLLGFPDLPLSSAMQFLGPYIRTYMLSRSMDQLRAAIPAAPPPPIYKDIDLPFETEEEAEFYRGMTGIIQRRWRALDIEGGSGAALEKLKLFMRLRQLSLHPQIYIAAQKARLRNLYKRPDWLGASTKFNAIRNLICQPEAGPDAVPPAHRWIIFCHFHAEMDMLATLLRAQPQVGRVQLYHGGLTAQAKTAVIEESKTPVAEGKHSIILVQLQSGGVGLNLQHFDRIIFSGPWWTKALMEQAVGRAVRIGQRAVVEVYRMTLEEETALNIDKYMLDKAETKGELCLQVLMSATRAILPAELADAPVHARPPRAATATEVISAAGCAVEARRQDSAIPIAIGGGDEDPTGV